MHDSCVASRLLFIERGWPPHYNNLFSFSWAFLSLGSYDTRIRDATNPASAGSSPTVAQSSGRSPAAVEDGALVAIAHLEVAVINLQHQRAERGGIDFVAACSPVAPGRRSQLPVLVPDSSGSPAARFHSSTSIPPHRSGNNFVRCNTRRRYWRPTTWGAHLVEAYDHSMPFLICPLSPWPRV